MSRFRLLHVTEFEYDGPVTESYNEVRLRPRDDAQQSCLAFRLSTRPAAGGAAHTDYFGNWVHRFGVLAPHRRLRIEADSVVLVHEPEPLAEDVPLAGIDARRGDVFEDYFDFLGPSRYVPHLAALGELVRAVEGESGGTVGGFARAAAALVHERFRYAQGATHVHSSTEDVLAAGAGVCQDFAHLLLGVARLRGIPARYVSGYQLPVRSGADGAEEEIIGGLASHAWAEVLVAGSGWLGLDPTQGRVVAGQHVRVAYGRDYGDVAPVRGVYRGHAGQRLSVDVRVRPAVDGSGCERLREPAGVPEAPPPMEPAPQ